MGVTMQAQSDHAQSEIYLQECLDIYRILGDAHGIATALANLGLLAQQQGQYERARALYVESMAFALAPETERQLQASLAAPNQGEYTYQSDQRI
jgi:hypothetical protein